MSAQFDLSGKTALVTGASRGLGFEMGKALVEAGATVFFNSRTKENLIDKVTDLPNAHICAFDVTKASSIKLALEAIGPLDILVNNVGVRDRRSLNDFSLDDVRSLLESNLIAPFELARSAAQTMQAGGRIINVTSIAGDMARANDAIYTATKAGLTGLTRAMAAELGPKGINVNAIAPGYFATEANQSMVNNEEVKAFLELRTSVGRWGLPHEIGGACVFLASPAASYMTGQVLTIDGGMSAHF